MFVRGTLLLAALAAPAAAFAQDADTPVAQEPNDGPATTETAPAAEPAPVASPPPATIPEAPPPKQTRAQRRAEAQARRDAEQATTGGRAYGLDIEDRGNALDTQKKKLETRVFFETEWHEFNNIDFRARDESSDQAILDSDDRNGFAFTGVSLDLGYQIDESTRIVMGTSYRGLWGGDQFGNTNRFGGLFYFTSMYIEWTPQKGGYHPTFRLGRQRFDLGGMGGAREFILGDIVDQLRIDFPLGKIGTLVTVPVEVVGLSAENDDVNFVSYVGQQKSQVFGFRGDRMTRRHGAVLMIQPEMVPDLDVRAYGYYTDIGALGSGSDISYNGRLGNFSDNDWIFNYGVRASYTIADLITPFASFDGSTGIDRKELVTYDVDTNGFAWSAGVVLDKPKQSPKGFGAHAELQYFEATGPAYSEEGLQYSHGYVGMKARHVGGLLANRFFGWHPTAYLGATGVRDEPQTTDRKAGTRVISLDTDLRFPGPVSVGLGYWFLQDTGITFVDFDRVDTLTPPYGYSREEFYAQERLGRVLGHEVNASVGVKLSKHLDLVVQGGALVPGKFYALPIARVAGTALGSSDPQVAWDFSGGARVSF